MAAPYQHPCRHGFGVRPGADHWRSPARPSRPDRVVRLCHDTAIAVVLLDRARDPTLAECRSEPRQHRVIGVIHRPETAAQSLHARGALAQQFDARIWFDETQAITSLRAELLCVGIPDSGPLGL